MSDVGYLILNITSQRKGRIVICKDYNPPNMEGLHREMLVTFLQLATAESRVYKESGRER